MNSPDRFAYVSAQLTQSAATSQILKCSLRALRSEDILLVRKDSVVLLCQDDHSPWFKHAEQEFRRPIKNALILRASEDTDTLVLCDDAGFIYLLRFVANHFTIVRRFGSVHINEVSQAFVNYHLSLDPLGRALCSLSAEDEITIYSIAHVNGCHELSARNIFRIPGFMLQSCFLMHNNNLISLVVHVSAGSGARLILLHWKAGDGLDGVQPREMPLDTELSLCLHVLALQRRPGYFLHVTADCLSLISSHHVHCGDLNFERCALELSGALPSSITEVTFGNEELIALVASDRGDVLLVSLDLHGNLSATSLGSLPIPSISLCLLSIDDDDDDETGSWTVFAASENGHTGVFMLRKSTVSTATSLFIENLPVRDLCIHEPENTPIQSCVVTVAGNRVGSIALQRLALVNSPVRDIHLSGMDRTPENIFSVYGRYGIAYVLISMPWGSQLLEYQVEEEELTDVSLDFEIEAKYTTILFCAVGEAFGKSFLQVTSNGVHNCANLRMQKSLYSIGSASAIILARLYSKTLVLVMLTDEVYTMKLLTLIKDEDEGFAISETDNELTFEIEPTVLRIEAAPENDGIYLTLCFANNRIAIWCYSSQASLVKLHDFSLCPAADSADAEESLIPYDCTVLVHGNKWHVLVAYHTGIAKHFLLREKELVLKRSRRLSTSPVRLLSEADNQESLYFVGEHCGRISILDHELVVDMIVFPDRQPESTIYCLNPFFNAQTDVQSFGFLCYESGWLTFYTIPQEISQAQDAIDIAETPRRLLYIAHLNCYVLATDRESIQGNYEKSAKVGANICIVQNGVCISESPLRDSRKETEIFRSEDVIYALAQWQVVIHGKERSWTVVGSSRKITKTATIEGRLTVLRLKQSGNKIDVRKEFSPSYSAPIYALCVFDETSLVIGHGDALEVTMLDIDSRALATQSQLQLRSPVIAIHVSGKYVFVATQKDSIMVFEYENSVLKLVAADPYPRLSVSLALINENTLVLTDKHKNLSVYDWSPTTGKLNVNCTISMPSIIIRAKRLSVPRLDSEDVLTDFTPDRHVILAAGLDGSLYAVFRVKSTLKVLIDDHEAKESPNLFRTLTLPKIIASLTDEEMRTLLDEFEITEAADVRKSLVAAMTRRTSRLLA